MSSVLKKVAIRCSETLVDFCWTTKHYNTEVRSLFNHLANLADTLLIYWSYIFWDIVPCSPLKVNQCFGVTIRLHLQDRIISQWENRMKQVGSYCTIYDLRFSQRWLWRMPSSGMWRRVDLKWTDVSEECITSTFREEQYASEKPAWAGGSRMSHQ
jgi:hypothetical protein